MGNKFSGNINKSTRVIVIDENTWTVESSTVENGNYEVPVSSGVKTIVGITDDGQSSAYGYVTPIYALPAATGGVITYDGDYKIHTFLSSDQITVTSDGTMEVLIVGAGGGGGYGTGGGGGAGGLLHVTDLSVSRGTYDVTVGLPQGTTGYNNPGDNGQDSVFYELTALGGGGGGSQGTNSTSRNGKVGGSGGGGCGIDGSSGGAGTEGQGNNGVGGSNSYNNWPAGGGGGAGANGSSYNGGNGLEISITGTPTYYAGGGAGGQYTAGGTGGLGGGGDWGQPGTANTGGGGGGGKNLAFGSAGGSGIVILRYKYQ